MDRMNRDTNTNQNNMNHINPRLTDEEVLHYADSISFGSEPALTGNPDTARGTIQPSGLRIMDELKFREVIARLKRLFDSEYRACKAARQALSNELNKRTEAERLLRTAIAEARNEVNKKRTFVQQDVPDYATMNANHHRTPSSTQSSPTASMGKHKTKLNNGRATSAHRHRSGSASSSESGSGISTIDNPYDELKIMSREERQDLLTQLLCQDAVLNALPLVVFPSREEEPIITKGKDEKSESKK